MNYLNEFEEDCCEDTTPLDFADNMLIIFSLALITVGFSFFVLYMIQIGRAHV